MATPVATGEQGKTGEVFEILLQGFSSYIQALKKSPNTVLAFTQDVRRWYEWWQRPVEFFDVDEWDDYTAHLEGKGLSGFSIIRYQTSVKRFYKYLRRKKLCTNDPARDSETIATEKKLPVFLEESEVEAILSKITSPRKHAQAELLYSCGLRVEELCTLKLSQLGATSVQIYGKGRKHRIVPLPAKTKAVVDFWLRHRVSKTEYLFPSPRDGKLDQRTVREMVVKLGKAAGVSKEIGPHTFRHSIATHLAARKVPVEHIQVFLGHENISTTMVYVRLAKQLTQEAVMLAHPRS